MPRRGGAAPKSPDQQANSTRARRDAARMKTVESEPCEAPFLPDFPPIWDDTGDQEGWPDQTLEWWKNWTQDPLTLDYRMPDWLDLMDCAVVHARLWLGDPKAAAELRLRMARHGATREDRARLRITFANADEAERKAQKGATAPATGTGSKDRRGGLKAVQ
ncbi:terminase small subunit [Gordonia phage Fribs8]|nr:terminase small subunit [Gordonia phage Fribs8]